jgi:hypothetical protein
MKQAKHEQLCRVDVNIGPVLATTSILTKPAWIKGLLI